MFTPVKIFNPLNYIRPNSNNFIYTPCSGIYKVRLYTSKEHSILNELFERISYTTFSNSSFVYSSIRIYQSPLSIYNLTNFIDITRTYFPTIDDTIIQSEISIVFPMKTLRVIEQIFDTHSKFSQMIEVI